MTSSMLGQKARSARKDTAHRAGVKPFLPDANDNRSKLFTMFRRTKPKTPPTSSRSCVEVPVLPANAKALAFSSAGRPPLVENTDWGSQKDVELEVTFDLNESIDLYDNSESAVMHERAAMKEDNTVHKGCRSQGMNHVDSGYTSILVEKSPVPSPLFYLPESYLGSFALVRPSEEPPSLKQRLSPVNRLLSQSPPSWNGLDEFENMVGKEESLRPFQKPISETYAGRLQDKGFPAASEAGRSQLLYDDPERKVPGASCASVPSRETAAIKAEEELPWNDSFDSLFDNEEFTEIPQETPAVDHPLTNNLSNQYCCQRDKEDLGISHGKVILDEEKRVRLLEDEHIFDKSNAGFPRSSGHLARSGSGEGASRPAAERGCGPFPSEVCCETTGTTCPRRPTSSRPPATAVSGDGSGTEQSLGDDELYDCSEELFSVNFDLGFSIEECENENFEENTNTNTRKLSSASGSHADVSCTEDTNRFLNDSSRVEMSPERDCRHLARRDSSTPLPCQSRTGKDQGGTRDTTAAVLALESGDRRRGHGSPAALASTLCTPTSRKVGNVGAVRRIPVNVSSGAREEIPELPPADKAKQSAHRQDFGRSAMGAPDSPLGRTELLADTDVRSCRMSPAAGKDSVEQW